MKFVRLTPYRFAALEALARYTFLVPPQFLRLGITTNRQNLNRSVLIPLRSKPHALIDYGNVGPFHVYCLSKRGAMEIARQWQVESVPYPNEGVQFSKDLNHRVGTVDFLIELHDWAEQNAIVVDFYHTYFQGAGAQRGVLKYVSATRHQLPHGFIESDIDLKLTFPDKHSALCVVEIHRGHHVKRIIDQLERHMIALHHGVVSERYEARESNLVLSVYENEATMKSVMGRLSAWPKFQAFREFFYFATLDCLKEDFRGAWSSISTSPRLFEQFGEQAEIGRGSSEPESSSFS